ncbi:hypothetical protein TNCV_23911 [Trichonephila clavipes]|nr:hypothetical protein TNCV_23911 [Trichonephila clavipes]
MLRLKNSIQFANSIQASRREGFYAWYPFRCVSPCTSYRRTHLSWSRMHQEYVCVIISLTNRDSVLRVILGQDFIWRESEARCHISNVSELNQFEDKRIIVINRLMLRNPALLHAFDAGRVTAPTRLFPCIAVLDSL